MNLNRYLNKLNFKFKQDVDELYYIYHKGIKVSPYGVDKSYPDLAEMLFKDTIQGIQDIKRRKLLGNWWKLKSRIKAVDDRLVNLRLSYHKILDRIQEGFTESDESLTRYDRLDFIADTLKENKKIKKDLISLYNTTFKE